MHLPSETPPLDLTALAQPLAEACGGGRNIEYAPEFLELEEEVLGKPEVQYGDTITQAGQTLQMQDGRWVPLARGEDSASMADLVGNMKDPYAAFEAGAT